MAALAPALAMAFTQPVWSRVDEAQHFDFIAQLAHGVYPVADQTTIQRETLDVSEATGVFRAFYAPGTYPKPDVTAIGPIPAGMSQRADAAWMLRHVWQLSHESLQTPLYYLTMVPVYAIADPLAGPLAAIYLLRVINALILATMAPMAFAIARLIWPTQSFVTLPAAIFVILLPGLQLNGTRVSNDTLGAAVGGVLTLLAVRWVGGPWTWRRVAVLGSIAGIGLMVKLTLAGLLPVLAVAMLWPACRTRPADQAVRLAAAYVLAFIAIVPWLMWNLHAYGGVVAGSRAERLADSLPGSPTAALAALNVSVFHITFWTGEPWGVLPLAAAFAIFGLLLGLMAVAGVLVHLRTRSSNVSRARLVVASTAVLSMVAVSLLLPLLGNFEFLAPGRYAYPAVVSLAALCAVGLCTVLSRRSGQWALTIAYTVSAAGILGAGALGLVPAERAGSGAPPTSARVVSVAAQGHLEDFAIRVDNVAFDPEAGATWFEVRAVNSGSAAAEWPVVPVATAGAERAFGQYLRSTHMAGDLPAGDETDGWVFVPIDPSVVTQSRSVLLRFADVALDSYGTVGDIEVIVALPDTP